MIKRVMVILLGCSLTMAVQASPLQKIMPFKGVKPITSSLHQSIKAQAVVSDEGYTNFTGEWAGKCHVKEGDTDDDTPNVHFVIENNATWIKISDDGISEEYDIGKDLSLHQEDKTGFSVYHFTFNWLNNETLLFNFIDIENHLFLNLPRSVNGTSARVTWRLQQDTLLIRAEVQRFENDVDTFHTVGSCEYVRQ